MVKIVIIEKTGQATECDYPTPDDLSNLYKKCHFRKANDFEELVEWSAKTQGKRYKLKVFGRTDGKHNAVNAFEFPPPIDKKLLYGACAIVSIGDNSSIEDLDVETWSRLYSKLYGGFEDLSKTELEDEVEEDELEEVPDEMKTTTGYLKDGFVVEGTDSSDEPIDSDHEKPMTSHSDTEDEEFGSESPEEMGSDEESELSHEDYIED